jgi:hypothetical protein
MVLLFHSSIVGQVRINRTLSLTFYPSLPLAPSQPLSPSLAHFLSPRSSCPLSPQLGTSSPHHHTLLPPCVPRNAGGTALHKDPAGIEGFGYFPDFPSLVLDRISQECGVVTAAEPIDFAKFTLGTVLRLIPNHSCMTAAGHATYAVVDDKRVVVDTWLPCSGW